MSQKAGKRMIFAWRQRQERFRRAELEKGQVRASLECARQRQNSCLASTTQQVEEAGARLRGQLEESSMAYIQYSFQVAGSESNARHWHPRQMSRALCPPIIALTFPNSFMPPS